MEMLNYCYSLCKILIARGKGKRMKVDHIALYVQDLEKSSEFFEKYFGGIKNHLYYNPKTGLRTYFIHI